MKVPFLDLQAQYQSIKTEVDEAIQQVITRTAFAGGPFVSAFEERFAAYCHSRFGIGVSSGTSALWLALIALEIGPGDEVITAANTFIATAEAICMAGAKPVFVDIEENTHNLNPQLLEAAITPRTRAIIPVHLFGQMADMDAIMATAQKYQLRVIEDASQAHGAEYRGRRAGSIGDIGCFSFYPGKNLGAYGEAGGIVTDDERLADKMKMFRDHGQSKKYYHDIIGWNARMDGIQGAILNVKLNHIEAWTELRRQHAQAYLRKLDGIPELILPREADYARHVYHIFAIRTADRDALIADLAEKEIYCGIHYPLPLPLQEACSDLGYTAGDFPVTEACAAGYVSLPMFAELSAGQIDRVSEAISEFVQKPANIAVQAG